MNPACPRFQKELLGDMSADDLAKLQSITNWLLAGAADLLADLTKFGEARLTPQQEQRVNELLAECDRGGPTSSQG